MSAPDQLAVEGTDAALDLSFSVVEIGGSGALGADVRLELSPRITVLVGRNGAGKSLLLETIEAGLFAATGAPLGTDPARVACEVEVPTSDATLHIRRLRYECQLQAPISVLASATAIARVNRTDRDEAKITIDEVCRVLEPQQAILWRVNDGVLTYDTGDQAAIPVGRTLLDWISQRRGGQFKIPRMATPLRNLLTSFMLIRAGITRGDTLREQLALPYPEPQGRRGTARHGERLRELAYSIVWLQENDVAGRFAEVVALGRRIGLLDDIKVKLYRDPDKDAGTHRLDLVNILVDGCDLGLLSDGTLRVLEILVWLVSPAPKLLLIEEPETAVHPGMLSKLLAELSAYSDDRQIVLSTQSPQVVSWADPLTIRLVERRAAHTTVRRLDSQEVARMSSYLHDEGTLGDFVYSGALDG